MRPIGGVPQTGEACDRDSSGSGQGDWVQGCVPCLRDALYHKETRYDYTSSHRAVCWHFHRVCWSCNKPLQHCPAISLATPLLGCNSTTAFHNLPYESITSSRSYYRQLCLQSEITYQRDTGATTYPQRLASLVRTKWSVVAIASSRRFRDARVLFCVQDQTSR